MSQKIKFSYSNDKETKSITVTVKLSTELRLFFSHKDLPEEILTFCEINPESRSYFEDSVQLKSHIENLIDQYEASFIQASKAKVICYFASFTDAYHSHDLGLEIGFRVLDKVRLGEDEYFEEIDSHNYKRRIDNPFRNFDGKFHEMPWTQEREEWFCGIMKAMTSLSEDVQKGLSKIPELLAKRIDNGSALVLNPSKKD